VYCVHARQGRDEQVGAGGGKHGGGGSRRQAENGAEEGVAGQAAGRRGGVQRLTLVHQNRFVRLPSSAAH